MSDASKATLAVRQLRRSAVSNVSPNLSQKKKGDWKTEILGLKQESYSHAAALVKRDSPGSAVYFSDEAASNPALVEAVAKVLCDF